MGSSLLLFTRSKSYILTLRQDLFHSLESHNVAQAYSALADSKFASGGLWWCHSNFDALWLKGLDWIDFRFFSHDFCVSRASPQRTWMRHRGLSLRFTEHSVDHPTLAAQSANWAEIWSLANLLNNAWDTCPHSMEADILLFPRGWN